MLRKRNYGAKLVELSPASLERSLSLPVQSRMPAAPARVTFPTPDSVPQASPGIAAGFLPLLVDPPANDLGPLKPTQLPQHQHASASSLSCGVHVSPPGTRRLLPAAGRQPRSHLLRGAHGAYGPIRRLAPTRPTADANSTARVRTRAPSRRRRDSVSPSPARRHLGP